MKLAEIIDNTVVQITASMQDNEAQQNEKTLKENGQMEWQAVPDKCDLYWTKQIDGSFLPPEVIEPEPIQSPIPTIESIEQQAQDLQNYYDNLITRKYGQVSVDKLWQLLTPEIERFIDSVKTNITIDKDKFPLLVGFAARQLSKLPKNITVAELVTEVSKYNENRQNLAWLGASLEKAYRGTKQAFLALTTDDEKRNFNTKEVFLSFQLSNEFEDLKP